MWILDPRIWIKFKLCNIIKRASICILLRTITIDLIRPYPQLRCISSSVCRWHSSPPSTTFLWYAEWVGTHSRLYSCRKAVVSCERTSTKCGQIRSHLPWYVVSITDCCRYSHRCWSYVAGQRRDTLARSLGVIIDRRLTFESHIISSREVL